MTFTASVSFPFLGVQWVQMRSLLHIDDPRSFPPISCCSEFFLLSKLLGREVTVFKVAAHQADDP